MLIVAGLSLKNLKPRVWDQESPYFIPEIRAVMVSYAELDALPARRHAAIKQGVRATLGIPKRVKVYLDNGAFYFLGTGEAVSKAKYEKFVASAGPDWYPIPREFIPTPAMSPAKQQDCFNRTMAVNRAFKHDGYVPVMHVSRHLSDYIKAIGKCEQLSNKKRFALGGIVPNLLRAPKALSYAEILKRLREARSAFHGKKMHVFGMGGTATVHLAALLGFDSIDSSGWRNRAARGLIQLPGSGDRMVASMGNWRGRELDKAELRILRQCQCPSCLGDGIKGLRADGIDGFCNRATHNLWVLIKEAQWVAERLKRGTYRKCFRRRLDNTIYLPLIEEVLKTRGDC